MRPHAKKDVINARRTNKSKTEGCDKNTSYQVAGTRTVECCAQHARNEMVDVMDRKCRTEDCHKLPLFGVAGTRTAECCAQHARNGMVKDGRKCRTEGCGTRSSFGVAGTRTTEYCFKMVKQGLHDERLTRSSSWYPCCKGCSG